MKQYEILNGFHPEQKRQYNGENIFAVKETRFDQGKNWYLLSNNAWIKEIGPNMYITDWTSEERWARVEEDGKLIGFMILVTDRSKGLL